jgi:hypothetical protein
VVRVLREKCSGYRESRGRFFKACFAGITHAEMSKA